MLSRWSKSKTPFTFCSVLIALMLLTMGCDDNPADGTGNEPSESITTLEGEVSGYDFGSQDLYESEDFVDLIEGTIDENGTFTVNLLGEEEIQDALKPLGDDEYVGMYCRESISESLSENHLFVDVGIFNFTYGEDNNLGTIGLSSESTNRNIYPPQSDHKGDYQVRWIYSTEEATISAECDAGSSGTEEVELELVKGWNEVIYDLSEPDTKKMYTEERPDEVDWVVDS